MIANMVDKNSNIITKIEVIIINFLELLLFSFVGPSTLLFSFTISSITSFSSSLIFSSLISSFISVLCSSFSSSCSIDNFSLSVSSFITSKKLIGKLKKAALVEHNFVPRRLCDYIDK